MVDNSLMIWEQNHDLAVMNDSAMGNQPIDNDFKTD